MISAALFVLLLLPQEAATSRPQARVVLAGLGPGMVLADARVPIEVRIAHAIDETLDLEFWLPPEVRVTGVPARVQLRGGNERSLPGWLEVEADRPAGPFRLSLRLRGADGGMRGSAELDLNAAVGRDLVRLSFEDRERPAGARGRGRARPGSRPAATGWPGGAAAVGAGHGRIEPGAAQALTVWGAGGQGPFAARRFPHVSLFTRGGAEGRLFLQVERAQGAPVRVPLVGADGGADGGAPRGWRRIAARLPEGDPVRRVLVAVDGPAAADVDEVAIAVDAGWTAADRLRDLTQRHAAGLDPASATAMQEELAGLGELALAGQDAVDLELLRHGLAWIRADAALPRKVAGRPAGEARFVAMVRHVQHLEHDVDALVQAGRAAILAHQRELDVLAQQIAPGKGWREVRELLAADHPSETELPAFAEQCWQDALRFVVTHDLVTVPMAARHGVVQPVTDGPLSRTYAFGGYGGARPSPHGYTGTYLVSPPAVWMDAAQRAERLRGNHRAWTRVVALHEMVPGHHLQTVVHLMRPLTPFRRSFYSTLFAEGWALYCEEMLAQGGFFPDAATRFAQVQMRLWRAARVVVDAELHSGRIDAAAAARIFVTEAGLTPESAKAEITRDIDAPTRPLSYYLGYRLLAEMVDKARRRDGTSFDLRRFLDRVLAFGPVPLPAVAKGMGL
ncbi:MAG: DUF885 family protein [Planctomycetes bacterium]|nr:DUF885 family protein [Planctomycetota bacterium]